MSMQETKKKRNPTARPTVPTAVMEDDWKIAFVLNGDKRNVQRDSIPVKKRMIFYQIWQKESNFDLKPHFSHGLVLHSGRN